VQPSYPSSSVLFGFSFSVIRITESLKFAAKTPGVCELRRWAEGLVAIDLGYLMDAVVLGCSMSGVASQIAGCAWLGSVIPRRA
jgi:hypothetical protein